MSILERKSFGLKAKVFTALSCLIFRLSAVWGRDYLSVLLPTMKVLDIVCGGERES